MLPDHVREHLKKTAVVQEYLRPTIEDRENELSLSEIWNSDNLYTEAFPYIFFKGVNDITNPNTGIWKMPVYDPVTFEHHQKRGSNDGKWNLGEIVFSHWIQGLLSEDIEVVLDNEMVVCALEHKIRVRIIWLLSM